MSWLFTPITIADGTEKDDHAKVDIIAAIGHVRGFAILLPGTASGQDAGIRVLAADRRMFPGMAEGADQWLYAQTFAINQIYEDAQVLQDTAPVLISVQGFNKSGGAITAQVGVRLEAASVQADQFQVTISSALTALVDVTSWPDIERQIRRIWTVARKIAGGNNDE